MTGLCSRCGHTSSDLRTMDDPELPPAGLPVRWCPECRGEGVVEVRRGRRTVGVHYLRSEGPERPRGT
ncbi:hypothetical protein [Streptomyces sp. DH37]|uniref:hypothetical protein n=1 Tax=Streptomyces sp. DH37 TaxID=3040122 RepID=UPI002441584E|nr:hypothetical protein [Streptomyces sp. DH37]MDG9705531.1 hypothetical protein [Streptomyces sp. DH37]